MEQIQRQGAQRASGSTGYGSRYHRYLRTERLILALVFAAKSNGHIDASEHAAIEQQMRKQALRSRAGRWWRRPSQQPAQSQRLAQGVKTKKRRCKLDFLSCPAIDIDHFMERSYRTPWATHVKESPGRSRGN
ncbi:DUF533 domain-containing protein [Enterobacter hormaechei]